MKTLSSKRTVYAASALFGFATWFGMQSVSNQDNFSDGINEYYFVALYVGACALGIVQRQTGAGPGIVLALSQLVAYAVYPNTEFEHSNLFPVAMALLLVFVAPVAIVSWLTSALLRVLKTHRR